MKKWEYVFLNFESDKVYSKDLNEMGQEGWELTHIQETTEGYVGIFKRPIEEK